MITSPFHRFHKHWKNVKNYTLGPCGHRKWIQRTPFHDFNDFFLQPIIKDQSNRPRIVSFRLLKLLKNKVHQCTRNKLAYNVSEFMAFYFYMSFGWLLDSEKKNQQQQKTTCLPRQFNLVGTNRVTRPAHLKGLSPLKTTDYWFRAWPEAVTGGGCDEESNCGVTGLISNRDVTKKLRTYIDC